MEDIAMLGLGVDSRPVDQGRDSLRKFEDQADKTERAAKGLEGTTALLTKAMGLLGAALSVTELIRMTSVWTDLNSRVRNAVSAHESARDVMDRIDEMARRTYSSLEQTADSYLRNASALTALGYSTAEQLDLTESLNNALVVSAIKGQAAESVMNAWSKAMALGKLNGDNLNTVIMSGGRVAEALADSMGVTVLELRKLGAEGKITSKDMFGITSQLEKLREEADAMPATIQDAFTLLNNALLSTVGRLDDATGASAAVADAVIFIGDNADALIPIIGALAGIITVALLPALWGMVAAAAAFAATPFGMIVIATGALAGAITWLWNEQRKADQVARDHADAIDTNAKAIEVAMTASQKYRQELRDQIAMQVEAAEAALTQADALTVAARAAAVAQSFDLFGVTISNPLADADAHSKMATSLALDGAYQKLEAQLAQIDAVMKTKPGADDSPGGLGGDPTKQEKGYDKLIAATERRIQSLEAEAAALGMTYAEALTLTNAQELLAEAERTGIELTPERIQQLLGLADAMTDVQMTLDGLQITMANRSPWEVMAEEVERLNELMDRGKITAADYWAEMGKAAEGMVGKYASAASGILGQAQNLSDSLFDIERQRIENSGLTGDELNAALEKQARDQFEVNKQIAMANAIVAGGEAIVKSYNWGTTLGGPVGGAVAAGLAAAATAAQIAAIASTSYQSKSAPATTASGGGGAAAAPQQQVQSQPATAVNVTLSGRDGYTRDQIRELLESMAEYSRDGSLIQVHIA